MQHIIHRQNFTSHLEFIAADVNQSGTVSVADIWQMRQMILGIQTDWDRSNWIFIASDMEFETIDQRPPTVREINLTGDLNNIDFIGVKIGDITGNATPE